MATRWVVLGYLLLLALNVWLLWFLPIGRVLTTPIDAVEGELGLAVQRPAAQRAYEPGAPAGHR